MARKLDLTKELADPFGSSLFNQLDSYDTSTRKLEKTLRIDLIETDQPLEYTVYLNRCIHNVFLDEFKYLPTDVLAIIETSISQR